METGGKIKDTADAVKGVMEAVPVYQDALQPAVIELGKALETIVKTVRVALAPLSALVWSYDRIAEFVESRVAAKLKDVPPDRIITPPPNVAVPALEALRYTGHDQILREFFANLLAVSLDELTVRRTHPAFVEIIKQLSPDEARIIKLFARHAEFPIVNLWLLSFDGTERILVARNVSFLGIEAECQHPGLASGYIDNLCRLRIAEVLDNQTFSDQRLYESFSEHPAILSHTNSPDGKSDGIFRMEKIVLSRTDFGQQFCSACVSETETTLPTLSQSTPQSKTSAGPIEIGTQWVFS